MNSKRLLACLIASTLAVGMVSCGAPAAKEPAAESAGDAPATTDTPKEEPKTDEAAAPATNLTLFMDEAWWPYDTWKGAIPEEFNKRANVNIQVTRAADDKQLPLMVASGDMTDLVCSYRYQYMANEQTSHALDTLKTEYPDVDFPVHSVLQFVNQASDGHYYTIGVGYSPNSAYAGYDKILTEGPGFFYRDDVAKELNLKFETLADLDTSFAAVKEAKGDMNVLAFNNIHQFSWLRQMMGVPTSSYYDNSGKLMWYIEAPNQLDYYKKVNEWYRLGYISPDNFAYQTEDETQQVAVSGKAFAVFGYDNHADNYNTAVQASGGDFTFSLVSDVIGEKAQKYDNFAGGRGLYVTKSAKEVEAAYKTLAYAYSDEGMKLLMWGMEGEDYTLNADNYPEFKYNFQGDNSVLEPRGLKYWGWMTHNAIVTGIADATSDSQTAKARAAMTEYVTRNPVIGMIRFATDSEESIISSKLAEMIKAEEINIYMADSEAACEEAYKAMVQKANDIGMQKLADYGNKTYAELAPQYDKIKDSAE